MTFKVFIFLGIGVTLALIFASIHETLFFAAIPLTIFLAYLYASPHARASFLRWTHLQPKNSIGNQQTRHQKHHKKPSGQNNMNVKQHQQVIVNVTTSPPSGHQKLNVKPQTSSRVRPAGPMKEPSEVYQMWAEAKRALVTGERYKFLNLMWAASEHAIRLAYHRVFHQTAPTAEAIKALGRKGIFHYPQQHLSWFWHCRNGYAHEGTIMTNDVTQVSDEILKQFIDTAADIIKGCLH